MRRAVLLGALGTVAVGSAVVYLAVTGMPDRGRAAPPASAPSTPATSPSTTPSTTTSPATRPAVDKYPDYLSALEPRLNAVEPEKDKVPLDVAAALITDRGVYVDRRGDLWVTHPDAPPVAEIVKTLASGKESVHVTRDEVVFAYWSRDARGNWVVQPVTRRGNEFVWHAPQTADGKGGAVKLARPDYRFDSAVVMQDNRVLVPSGGGVSAILPPPPPPPTGRAPGDRVLAPASRPVTPTAAPDAPRQTEPRQTDPVEKFAPLKTGKTDPRVFLIDGGAIAFRPWDNGDVGSDRVLRLAGGTDADWTELPEEEFPPKPIHVFALTDGSTLVLSVGEDAGLYMEVLLPLNPRPVDERQVEQLVNLLNDLKPETRKDAQAKLSGFGPGAWPVLERMHDAQTPEAQRTIDRILGNRAKPALGIFTVLPGPVRIVRRSVDGGLALFAFGGVNYLDLGKEALAVPALLLSVPGKRTLILHESVTSGENAERVELQILGDDVVVTDRVKGPLRLMGNHLAPMLRPEHRAFVRWLGTDRAGRYVFEDPATNRRLIMDPNYVDPSPRLPAWELEVTDGETGWDRKNQPAIRRGEGAGGGWSLEKTGWTALDKTTPLRKFDTQLPSASARLRLPDQRSVLLKKDVVELSTPGGGTTRIPLPPDSAGADNFPAAVVRSDTGKLFLLNRPGVITRLSPTPGGSFEIDARFTDRVPEDPPRRVWLDPHGRLCVAHGPAGLTVFFPEGRIPPEIANLVTNRAPKEK